MATNKMKLRHLYRAGEHEFLEQNYGLRFEKEDKNLSRRIERVITEDEEIQMALKQEEESKEDDAALMEKIEYLDTLDINQLRNMLKTTLNFSHKQVMKMKKEELIAELLK